jgi:transposase
MPRAAVMANQRGRILEARIAALAEHGYAGVRVSDIAERAGVSRATFYQQSLKHRTGRVLSSARIMSRQIRALRATGTQLI